MKAETKFRKRVDDFLDSLENCVHESIQQVAIRGTADKIICIHGWGIWGEIKDESGTPDPLQRYKASKWRNQGKGIAILWRPQNHEQVKSFLTLLHGGVFDRALLTKINKEENL